MYPAAVAADSSRKTIDVFEIQGAVVDEESADEGLALRIKATVRTFS